MKRAGTWMAVMVAVVAVAAGCGQSSATATSSGTTWTMGDVQTAMQKAGLRGFKQIPASEFTKGKQIRGVTADDLLGGFYYVSPNLAHPFGYTVGVAKRRSTITKIKAGLRAEGGPNGPLRFLDEGNVLISVLSSQPTAADKATAARLPLVFKHLQ